MDGSIGQANGRNQFRIYSCFKFKFVLSRIKVIPSSICEVPVTVMVTVLIASRITFVLFTGKDLRLKESKQLFTKWN